MKSAAPEPQPGAGVPDCELYTRQLDDGMTLADLFGNARPLEIEIGAGRGRFLIKSARDNPQVNYLGIERAYKFFHYTKQRVAAAGLANVRLLRAEAHSFLRGYVPDNAVRAFHIYFPDPWPKTRHRRRRLMTPEFFDLLRDRLAPGGAVHLATDVADYFDIMRRAGRGCPGLEELYCRSVDPAGTDPETAATHYERRFFLHGLPIYRAGFGRPPAPAP